MPTQPTVDQIERRQVVSCVPPSEGIRMTRTPSARIESRFQPLELAMPPQAKDLADRLDRHEHAIAPLDGE